MEQDKKKQKKTSHIFFRVFFPLTLFTGPFHRLRSGYEKKLYPSLNDRGMKRFFFCFLSLQYIAFLSRIGRDQASKNPVLSVEKD